MQLSYWNLNFVFLVSQVVYGEEMRRFSLTDRIPTFAELAQLLETLFGPAVKDCHVRYKDSDGDVVTSTHSKPLANQRNVLGFVGVLWKTRFTLFEPNLNAVLFSW